MLRVLLLLVLVSFVTYLLTRTRWFGESLRLRRVHRAATGALVIIAVVYATMVGMAIYNSG